MRRLRRVAGPAVAAAILLMATAAPAGAKMGPFTIEIAPESPTAGEAFRVTVRCWHDVGHTDRARCPSMGSWFEGFLWAVPAGSDRPEAEALPVEFVRRGGVLRANLVLATPGPWRLCVWTATPCDSEGDPGYPSRLDVLVLDRLTPTSSPASVAPSPVAAATSGSNGDGGTPSPVVAAAALAVVLAGALRVHRSRRR